MQQIVFEIKIATRNLNKAVERKLDFWFLLSARTVSVIVNSNENIFKATRYGWILLGKVNFFLIFLCRMELLAQKHLICFEFGNKLIARSFEFSYKIENKSIVTLNNFEKIYFSNTLK